MDMDYLACCGSTQFAKQMALASPFPSLHQAISAARDIWFNKVDVNGWLEAFSAHPQIGDSPSSKSPTTAQWSKGEQSTALATATSSTLQELSDWNTRYREKFGFIFIICASGRTTAEILAELKKRYPNRPILEFEIAAQEQMKVTELRLAKLFSTKETAAETGEQYPAVTVKKAQEDRVGIIGGHLTAASEASAGKTTQIPTRTRPPITTHVLDVSRGSPAAGVEVCLEMWKGTHPRPLFGEADIGSWVFQGSSTTDKDGRSGQLMSIVDVLNPGIYRISFNTGIMQGVKEKLQDMSAMRKAKADAKAEEKAEKELAKTRVDIAHEIRLAREAEATMDLHVNKVGEKIEREIAKHSTQQHPNAGAMANTSPTATAAGTGTGYRTDTAGDPIPITNTSPTNPYDAPGTNKWI